MPNLMWLFIIPFVESIMLFLFPPISKKNFKMIAVVLSLTPLAILLLS